jgi:hypothetical protein
MILVIDMIDGGLVYIACLVGNDALTLCIKDGTEASCTCPSSVGGANQHATYASQ